MGVQGNTDNPSSDGAKALQVAPPGAISKTRFAAGSVPIPTLKAIEVPAVPTRWHEYRLLGAPVAGVLLTGLGFTADIVSLLPTPYGFFVGSLGVLYGVLEFFGHKKISKYRDSIVELLRDQYVQAEVSQDQIRDQESRQLREARERRNQEIRDTAKIFVSKLHRKWFPGAEDVYDADYRISIFQRSEESWRCLARSGAKTAVAIKEWKCETDPSRYDEVGLVVWASIEGANMEARGVPEESRSDPREIFSYRKRCRLLEGTWRERSWQYATLRILLTRHHGRIPFIIVIERESGRPIAPIVNENFELEVQWACEFWCLPEGESDEE